MMESNKLNFRSSEKLLITNRFCCILNPKSSRWCNDTMGVKPWCYRRSESNYAVIINKSPVGLMEIKLLLPIILGFVFWKIRNGSRRFVTYSLGLVLVVYATVMGFHVYWVVTFMY